MRGESKITIDESAVIDALASAWLPKVFATNPEQETHIKSVHASTYTAGEFIVRIATRRVNEELEEIDAEPDYLIYARWIFCAGLATMAAIGFFA